MKLLAIETATEACSVALWLDGEVRERFEIAPRGHAARVLPWADALLAEAGLARSQLDAIAVGRGPGAFTGVRLAVAIGQGLALALDRPLLPVSTLAALALQAPGESVISALDARMGEVYLGAFCRDESGALSAVGEEWVASPATVPIPKAGRWFALGSGFGVESGRLAERLSQRLLGLDAQALPHAADIARIAALAPDADWAADPGTVAPAYLRDKVAQTLEERGAGRHASVDPAPR